MESFHGGDLWSSRRLMPFAKSLDMKHFTKLRKVDIAALHHAVRLPCRTVGVDPGHRIPQRRAGSVLLDEPCHAYPAAAVAARAGDIEVSDLRPEIRQRVLGLHRTRPGLRALTMRLARAGGVGSTTTGAPG